MGILDLLSLSGRLLPGVTRLAVIVVLVFFPALAVGVITHAGREEAARLEMIIHRALRREGARSAHARGHSTKKPAPGVSSKAN